MIRYYRNTCTQRYIFFLLKGIYLAENLPSGKKILHSKSSFYKPSQFSLMIFVLICCITTPLCRTNFWWWKCWLWNICKALTVFIRRYYYHNLTIITGFSNKCVRSYFHGCKEYHLQMAFNLVLLLSTVVYHQGSVRESHLFLLHITDLDQIIKFCKVHHLADDIRLTCRSKSIKKTKKKNLIQT